MLLTHAYAHLLADMHLAVFAPAFTFPLCESEYSRKPQVRIASVVRLRKNIGGCFLLILEEKEEIF